jgi:hypothetical protein
VEELVRRRRRGSLPCEVVHLLLLLLLQPGSLRVGCLSRCVCATAHPEWRCLPVASGILVGRCFTRHQRLCALPPAKPPRLQLPRQLGPSGLT